jgi:hypothetical protein
MIYYRLASQKHQSTEWEWISSIMDSLEAVLQLSQRYSAIPAERLRVFMASASSYLDVLLVRANLGLPSNSLAVEQLLQEQSRPTVSQIQSFELELGWSEEAAQAEAPQAVQVAEQEQESAQLLPVVCEVDYEPGGGDHDEPYTFTFPSFLPQARAWMRLRERVLAGELLS